MGTYSALVKQSNQKKREPQRTKESLPSEETQANANINKKASKFTSKHVYLQNYLNDKAFVTGSFRLPPSILEKFDEIFYLTKTKYRSDAKRYSFVIAALALLFWDFEKRGKDSDLYKLLIKRSPEKK